MSYVTGSALIYPLSYNLFPLIALLWALYMLLTTMDVIVCSTVILQKFLEAILTYSFKSHLAFLIYNCLNDFWSSWWLMFGELDFNKPLETPWYLGFLLRVVVTKSSWILPSIPLQLSLPINSTLNWLTFHQPFLFFLSLISGYLQYKQTVQLSSAKCLLIYKAMCSFSLSSCDNPGLSVPGEPWWHHLKTP